MVTTPILTQLLAYSVLAVMVIHSLLLWRKGQWRMMDPLNIFWAGCAVCYVEQPLSLYHIITTWQDEGTINLTLFWCAFGMMCVAVGYSWNPLEDRVFRFIPFFRRFTQQMPARLNQNRMFFFALLLIGIGLVGYAAQIASVGWTYWIAVGRGGTDYDRISGYVVVLAELLPAGTLMLLLSAEMFGTKGLMRVLSWVLNALMLLWMVYLGTRSRTVMYTMGIMAAYLLPRFGRVRITPWRICVVGVMFLSLSVITKFQALYRGQFTNLSFNLDRIDMDEAALRVVPHILTGAARDEAEDARAGKGMEFNCVATVVKLVPEETPYNYGFTLLEVPFRVVPHFLWPDKRYPLLEAQYPVMEIGGLSRMAVEGDGIHPMLAGPAFTYIGYWYDLGGPIGLIIGGIYTGSMLRTIRRMMDRDTSNQGAMLVYLSMLSIPFSDAAATPFTWIFTTPFVVLPTIVIVYLCRTRRPAVFADFPTSLAVSA